MSAKLKKKKKKEKKKKKNKNMMCMRRPTLRSMQALLLQLQ